MEIRTRVENDILVVECIGDIDVYSAPLVQEKLREFDFESLKGVVVDLSMTKYVDSSGLGVFVAIKKKSEEAGIPTIVVGCNDSIYKIFSLTRLDRIIVIEKDLPSAIERILG